MPFQPKTRLVALILAFGLTGAASACEVFEHNDGDGYGDASGWCHDRTGFTVRYHADSSGRGHSLDNDSGGYIQGSSEQEVITAYCAAPGG